MEDLNFLELVFVAAALSTIITVPLFLIVLTITGPGRRWLAPWARHTLWSLVLVRLLLPVSFGSPASLQPTSRQFPPRNGQGARSHHGDRE